jgi:Nitroreductase
MINEILRNKWSPYSFSSEPVDEEKLNSLFEAAGLAPSSNNEQPWLFVHTTRENAVLFDTIQEFMFETNKLWAKNAYALAISFAIS